MILDDLNKFSDAQAITATAVSENILDLGSARDIGTGEPLYLIVVVDVAFTDGSSDSTVDVQVQTDDNEGFSSPTTQVTAFTFAALSAVGTIKIHRLAPDQWDEQFVRLNYNVNNGNLSTGSLSAFLVHNIDKYVDYADNITITG